MMWFVQGKVMVFKDNARMQFNQHM